MLKRLFLKIQDQFFYAFAMLIFFLFFVVTVWGENGLLRLIELKRMTKNVASGNEAILRDNLLHVLEIGKLKNTSYVEERARTDLGLIRDSETVFVVPEK
jgi:cell division protein FtsB